MKRWIIAGGIMLALGAAGTLAWQRYYYYLPGLLQDWRDPVQPNRAISWASGPAAAPSSTDTNGADADATGRPPNVILIVVDDLGINDLSTDGSSIAGNAVPTPNINRIAQQGVNFSTAYAANATCSPSRAALMTGRYATRFGFEFTAVPPVFAENLAHGSENGLVPAIFHEELVAGSIDYEEMGVPQSEITIAELLRTRGYRTMHIGKWHLGESQQFLPNAQGFDESLQITGGASMLLPPDDPSGVDARIDFDPIDRFIWANLRYAVKWNGGPRFTPVGHLTDYFTDQAKAAVTANRDRPFFLYLSYGAPHTPLQATREDYDALPGISDHTTRVYAAMIRQLDRRIGDLMAHLEQLGIDDNTLVIFTSDNGGAWYTGIPDHNLPYRGWKATFFEGGIRTPLFMRWPARITPAGVRGDVTGHIDVFATIAAAAGVPVPADRTMDGGDLLAGPVARDAIYWRSGGYRAMRAGDWKLQVTERPARARLFNLAEDPTEQRDLAAAQPQRVAAMRAMLEAHNRQMAEPLWPGLLEGPVRIDVPLNTPWSADQDYIYWTN